MAPAGGEGEVVAGHVAPVGCGGYGDSGGLGPEGTLGYAGNGRVRVEQLGQLPAACG